MERSIRLAVQYASARSAPSRPRLRRWVAAALAEAPDVGSATLTLRFVDEDEGRTLNRTYRGKDYATNVLTFMLSDEPGAPPGGRAIEADLIVCLPVVAAEALAQGKACPDHCAHLVVHGVLHAAGHDHDDPVEADAMEALERRVLARFRIADPYADGHAAPDA